MGGVDPSVWAALIGAAGNAAGGALAPSPFQERRSLHGTGADPVSWLTQARNTIGQTFDAASAKANQPVDMSRANVQQPSRVAFGGGLPMPIGLSVGAGAQGGPASSTGGSGSSGPGASRVPFGGIQTDPYDAINYGGGGRTAPPGAERSGDTAVPRGTPAVPAPAGYYRRNPNPAGNPPTDRAVPRGSSLLPPAAGTRVNSPQDDTPGRAAVRLLLSSLQPQTQGAT